MKSLLSLIALVGASLVGCGGGYGNRCEVTGLTVTPTSATADHAASLPQGTAAHFVASTNVPDSCPTPLVLPDWSVSDLTDVSISSAKDASNGYATCLSAASSPVTVTANVKTGSPQKTYSATATLTCN